MGKENTVIWIDAYGDGGYSYEDFVDYCKEENWDMQEDELEIPAEYSESYREWVQEQIEEDIECFFANLQYSDANKTPVVVTGSLGLWWGRPSIEDTLIESLLAAVKKCVEECDYFKVYSEEGVLYVESSHHDGTNYFEIRPLTDLGAELMRDGKDIDINDSLHVGKFPKYLY